MGEQLSGEGGEPEFIPLSDEARAESMAKLGVMPEDMENCFGDPPAVRLERLETKQQLMEINHQLLKSQIEEGTAETLDKC